MATLADDSKNSMRYRVTLGNESSTRLLSGLNMAGSQAGTGVNPADGISDLAYYIQQFSQGQVDNLAYVQERTVTR